MESAGAMRRTPGAHPESGELLEKSRWFPLGAYKKILQQRLNIVKILFLNDCAQFGMNEEAKVIFLILKHEQDNRPESSRGAPPALLPVFQGTELKLAALVLLETHVARIHLSVHRHRQSFREPLVEESGLTAFEGIARRLRVPKSFSMAPAVSVPVSRAVPDQQSLQPSVNQEGIESIHSDICGDQGSATS